MITRNKLLRNTQVFGGFQEGVAVLQANYIIDEYYINHKLSTFSKLKN